jgi:hypothetical protein
LRAAWARRALIWMILKSIIRAAHWSRPTTSPGAETAEPLELLDFDSQIATQCATLERQAGDGHAPPLADRADSVRVGDPDLVEEYLVEMGVPVHLNKRT